MSEITPQTNASGKLPHYLSPMNAWALALGCSIGWGAFVMPATTLLPKAGPAGTIIGMLVAAAIMIVVAANFSHMLNRYPDSGGAFTFTKHTLGYDHAFLCAWALIIAYVAILWANATAFILIIRYLIGPVFQFGFHYTIAGYDVYFGEILVTWGILIAFGLFTCMKRTAVKTLNTVLALVLFFGVLACFLIVLFGTKSAVMEFEPAFGFGASPAQGVFGIIALAPWAFLGFEAVSHGAGELNFSPKRLFGTMAAGVMCGATIYILMTIVSVHGTPSSYDSWAEYISNLGNLNGLEGLPTFNAMQGALGTPGVVVLGIVVIAALSTTLLGLYRTAGRLAFAVADDGILPPWFSKLSKDGVPRNAILFIMAVSLVVPLVGRAAIGWIVDVTSVSAAIVYGYASVCAFIAARKEGNRAIQATGLIGVGFALVFLLYPLVPTIWSVSALAPESYMILAVWAIAGLILFRLAFKRDTQNRFGKSTVVWILLVFLILFSTTMWMRQIESDDMEMMATDLSEFYEQDYAEHNVVIDAGEVQNQEAYLEGQIREMESTLLNISLVQTFMILFSLIIMFNIYSLIRKREKEHEAHRIAAEETSKAKTAFLSNMSHDIRTPMNSIVGYTHLAQREGTTEEEMREYLRKVDAASEHLLALINDVLEMSRIENGKIELTIAEANLRTLLADVHDMFDTQMRDKDLTFTVEARDLTNEVVLCDANRLDRVLLNLVSNAYKFTPEGGSVSVSLTQMGDAEDGRAPYELRVKDTGIGMTPEFAARVFDAFERERSTTVSGIQGTGLGTAITKNIVDAMGGTITVDSEQGKGTEFIVELLFDVVEQPDDASVDEAGEASAESIDFTGMRILVVEDNEINREIASLMLEDAGFVLDTAENGQIAVEKVAASEPGYYDAILMDVQMPVMNGYEATQAIRELNDPALAGIPIIATTANAFAEDIQEARDAGMNAHVAKPIDVKKLMQTLATMLPRD